MTELEIYRLCLGLGMTPAGAAGCTANIMAESAGRPNNVEDRSGISDATYTERVDKGTNESFATDLYEYRQSDGTVVIRTKGALFQSWQSGANYNNNAYVFYKDNKTFQLGNYLTEGSSTHGSITVTRAFTGDAENTMTLTITGLSTSAAVAENYRYMRFCGLGSGANIDLRINENFG